ncbi:zinc finger protein 136-like isoform X2 [Cavia porcellus]
MRETLMNINAVGRSWDCQQIEEEYKNYSRNLRKEEIPKCYQFKICNSHENIFLLTPDANVDMQQAALRTVRSLDPTESLIGHLSLNVPSLHHTGEKLLEYLKFDVKLSKCNEYGKPCRDFQSFQKHKETKTREKHHQYEQITKFCSELSEKTHTAGKSTIDKKSMKASSIPSGFQIHERIHTCKKPYLCKQYEKTFNTQTHKIYEGIHMEKKPYVCKQCGKSFSRYTQCQNHESTHKGKKHVCKQCGKAFTRRNYCQIHEKNHTGEKSYMCKQCGKAFTLRSSFKRHERNHTGERHVCKQCGKAFTTKYYYKLHENFHTGEKPYVCKHCGMAFTTHHSCQRHERTHTGEKPYVCRQCGKAFSKPKSCQIHERSHADKKPYACEPCGKRFSSKSSFYTHRSHTGKEPYVYKQCGRSIK